MTNVSQSLSNITEELIIQDLLRIGMFSTISTLPSFVFLYINGTMLYTLRSKRVFRETCRYILLYNLLFADTVLLAQSQVMFLLSTCRVKMAFSLCIVLSMLAHLTNGISPLTLVVMPLERYVAVCFPLRYASIVTIRNTAMAVALIWAVSSLNNLTRGLLFSQFVFKNMSLQMTKFCSDVVFLLGSHIAEYDKAYTCVLFVSAGVAVTFAYFGVIIAARSASTDKVLAHKARNTLLLHLVQLALSFSSTFYNPLVFAFSAILTKSALLWVQCVFYVCFVIFPRCLSSLIYGLRDQTIRPVLVYHLYCRLKAKISS